MAVAVKEIKSRIDILDVIGADVALTKKGPHYWGLCPFHGEKTPSFKVDRDKQRAVCYGCSWSGDVLSYVMKRDNLTFREALHHLGDRFGVTAAGSSRKAITEANRKRELIKKAKAELKQEYLRLVEIESWIWHILRTVTGPGDYNRPAVIWALDNRDRLDSYLSDWHRGEMKERLQLMQLTKGVKMWAS